MINKIINADCFDILKDIPNNSIDLCLTDPPYQMHMSGAGFAKKRNIYKEISHYTNTDNDFYNDDFLDILVSKCKFPNVFLFCGKNDLPKILNYAIKNKYFYFILPLCKKNPMPFINNTWLSNEFSVHFTDRRILCSKDYSIKIPYFITGNEKQTKHPNEKNINDVKKVIINLTNEGNTVLDCFSGSGSVAIACHELKRNFICIEKDEQYYKESNKRLLTIQNQPTLF